MQTDPLTHYPRRPRSQTHLPHTSGPQRAHPRLVVACSLVGRQDTCRVSCSRVATGHRPSESLQWPLPMTPLQSTL